MHREWLLAVEPHTPTTLADAAGSAANTADAVARVGEGAVCWAIDVGRGMAERIVAEIPAFGGGRAPFEVLRQGTESSVVRALVLLVGAELSSITEESLDGIREFVRRGISLDGVLRGIRLGHAEMAHAFLQACEARVEQGLRGQEMKAVTEELFVFVDGFADAMTREYLAEYDRWTTSAAATRAATVRTVLAGDGPLDVAAASQVLDYDLTRRHLGLTVRTASASTSLHLAADSLLRARGATATLVVPVGAGELWAWGVLAGEPGPVGDAPAGVLAAFGAPGTGVAGFRRTHAEAVRAERVRRLARVPEGCTDYPDVVVAALLSTDLVAAGEFVRRELGPLAEDGDAVRALRTTLLAYLDAERSLVAVAARLHVARGTVAYRVKRAEQLLGREIGERRPALHAALLLAAELGSAVLGSAALGDPAAGHT